MCLGCYDEFFGEPGTSAPPPLTAEMDALAAAISEGDRDSGLEFSGLHIVIADWNLATRHIKWCRKQADDPLTPQQDDIARRLLALSEAERYVVMKAAEQREMAG